MILELVMAAVQSHASNRSVSGACNGCRPESYEQQNFERADKEKFKLFLNKNR